MEGMIPMSLSAKFICGVVIATVAHSSQARDLAVYAANQQISYALMVAEEQQRIDSDHYDWLYEIVANATSCDADSVHKQILYMSEEPIELTKQQSEGLNRYLELNCQPYEDWILETIDQCDVEVQPSWCESAEGVAQHLNVSGFLNEFVVALEGSSNSLERYNLMATMTSFLGSHFSASLPEEILEPLFAKAARDFLETASFDEVLKVVTKFQHTALGLLPAVRDEVLNYVESSPHLDPNQRNKMVETVEKRWFE